jgi:hypothetical protein
MELKAIGETTAETLTRDLLFRDFKNRRQIGSYCGLTPSPYQSGEMSHESGISRAGNGGPFIEDRGRRERGLGDFGGQVVRASLGA